MGNKTSIVGEPFRIIFLSSGGGAWVTATGKHNLKRKVLPLILQTLRLVLQVWIESQRGDGYPQQNGCSSTPGRTQMD